MKTVIKTVAGLLETRDETQFAVQDLVTSGFPRETISIRSSDPEHAWPREGEVIPQRNGGSVLAREGAGDVFAPNEAAGAGSRGNAYETKVPVAAGDVAAFTALGLPEADARFCAEGVRRGGFAVTVTADIELAEEIAEILRRHGAVGMDAQIESWRREGWTGVGEERPLQSGAVGGEPGKAAGPSEPLSQGSFTEQLERMEAFEQKEELPRELAEQRRHEKLFEQRETLPHRPAAEEEQTREQGVRQSQEDVRQAQSEVRQPGGYDVEQPGAMRPPEAQQSPGDALRQQPDIAAMDDDEFERHFRATYGGAERFDEPYRSAYHFAEAESASHPQFLNRDWFEVEEEIHQDWERAHPGTWQRFEDAIHFGWNRSHRH